MARVFYYMTFLTLLIACHSKLNFSFLSLCLTKLKRKKLCRFVIENKYFEFVTKIF